VRIRGPDLLTTAGPFVPLVLAALLLGPTYLVLDPTPPRHVLLATGPAHSDIAEFGACISSERGQGPACRHQPSALPKPRQWGLEVQMLALPGIGWIAPGQIVDLRATNSDESTTGWAGS
jgi:hypothetical protein